MGRLEVEGLPELHSETLGLGDWFRKLNVQIAPLVWAVCLNIEDSHQWIVSSGS